MFMSRVWGAHHSFTLLVCLFVSLTFCPFLFPHKHTHTHTYTALWPSR